MARILLAVLAHIVPCLDAGPGTYTRLRQETDCNGVALGRAAQNAGVLGETIAALLDGGEPSANCVPG